MVEFEFNNAKFNVDFGINRGICYKPMWQNGPIKPEEIERKIDGLWSFSTGRMNLEFSIAIEKQYQKWMREADAIDILMRNIGY
jgi:hypothetical protein